VHNLASLADLAVALRAPRVSVSSLIVPAASRRAA
jgi:hypothetical protein